MQEQIGNIHTDGDEPVVKAGAVEDPFFDDRWPESLPPTPIKNPPPVPEGWPFECPPNCPWGEDDNGNPCVHPAQPGCEHIIPGCEEGTEGCVPPCPDGPPNCEPNPPGTTWRCINGWCTWYDMHGNIWIWHGYEYVNQQGLPCMTGDQDCYWTGQGFFYTIEGGYLFFPGGNNPMNRPPCGENCGWPWPFDVYIWCAQMGGAGGCYYWYGNQWHQNPPMPPHDNPWEGMGGPPLCPPPGPCDPVIG